MNAQIDLKGTERNSFKLATYADGVNDITLGMLLILLGLYPVTWEALGPVINTLLFLISPVVIVQSTFWIRKRLTSKRTGLVKFGPSTNQHLKVALLITSLILIITAVLWDLSGKGYFIYQPAWLGAYGFDIIFSMLFLAYFWFMAYNLELTRYYLYGLLFGGGVILSTLTPDGWYMGSGMLIAGLIILASGIIFLARFLKEFPNVVKEEV